MLIKMIETRILAVGLALAIALGAYIGYTYTAGSGQTESCSACTINQPANDEPVAEDKVPATDADDNNTPIEEEQSEFGNDSEIGKPCSLDSDCRLPFSYAAISRCPYEMRCAAGACEVYCPWDEIPPKEPVLTLFWGVGCQHCAEEKEFLEDMQEKYPDLEITMYEVKENQTNLGMLLAICQDSGLECASLPVTFIGETAFLSFRNYDGKLSKYSGQEAYVGYKNQMESEIKRMLGIPTAGMTISASVDKAIYFPGDEITITAAIESDGELERCYVEANGIRGKSGTHFTAEAFVDLRLGENVITLKGQTPSCSSCSGVKFGEHEIRVWVEQTGEVLAETSVTIRISEEE